MCIIRIASIIWRSGDAIQSSSRFSTIVADLTSPFLRHSYVAWSFQQCAKWAHFLAAKSYFQCAKNGQGDLARRQRLTILNFKYSHKPENARKKFRVISSQNDIQFSIYSCTSWTTAPSLQRHAVNAEALLTEDIAVYNRVTQRRGPLLQSLA